jgi:hypothetical protein
MCLLYIFCIDQLILLLAMNSSSCSPPRTGDVSISKKESFGLALGRRCHVMSYVPLSHSRIPLSTQCSLEASRSVSSYASSYCRDIISSFISLHRLISHNFISSIFVHALWFLCKCGDRVTTLVLVKGETLQMEAEARLSASGGKRTNRIGDAAESGESDIGGHAEEVDWVSRGAYVFC